MSNRADGDRFEQEFCELASACGFYAHNNKQSKAGQPFDVQLCRENISYQIDCKLCSTDTFEFKNIRPNQRTAFELLMECGCQFNYFAVKFYIGEIKLLRYETVLKLEKQGRKGVNRLDMKSIDFLLIGGIFGGVEV